MGHTCLLTSMFPETTPQLVAAISDLETLKCIEQTINERVENITSMSCWWARVREEIQALNFGPEGLENTWIAPEQLNELRTRWEMMGAQFDEKAKSLQKQSTPDEVS
jgi:hypothetical protein